MVKELANYLHFGIAIDNYFIATNSRLMAPQLIQDLLKSRIYLSKSLICSKSGAESYLQARCYNGHWCNLMPGYLSNDCSLVVVFKEAVVCSFKFDFQQ